jgi:hypothetical protein
VPTATPGIEAAVVVVVFLPHRYNNVINEMLAAGIEPVATICESANSPHSSMV